MLRKNQTPATLGNMPLAHEDKRRHASLAAGSSAPAGYRVAPYPTTLTVLAVEGALLQALQLEREARTQLLLVGWGVGCVM